MLFVRKKEQAKSKTPKRETRCRARARWGGSSLRRCDTSALLHNRFRFALTEVRCLLHTHKWIRAAQVMMKGAVPRMARLVYSAALPISCVRAPRHWIANAEVLWLDDLALKSRIAARLLRRLGPPRLAVTCPKCGQEFIWSRHARAHTHTALATARTACRRTETTIRRAHTVLASALGVPR
jgi:hypothetical protein